MKIIRFLNLIRWPNLIMIMLSMIFIRWFVIIPLLGSGGLTITLFVTLLLSVLFITIAGYIINDYFDMEADSINKPGKNIIGTTFSEAWAKNVYYFFSALGIAGGLFLSWQIGKINYSLIFLLTVSMLWYYSQRYQCQPFTGNLVVAFLSALSFGLVWLYEFFAIKDQAGLFSTAQPNFSLINKLVLIYMGIAFFASLFREMIKDMEDRNGDSRVGCRTLPVVAGMDKAKTYTLAVGTVMLVFLLYVQYFLFLAGYVFVFGYFTFINLFLIFMLFKLYKAKIVADFGYLSTLAKVFMAAGILSMLLFYFEH